MERLNNIVDRYGGHYSFVIGLLLPFGMVANNIAMVMVLAAALLSGVRHQLQATARNYRSYAILILVFCLLSLIWGGLQSVPARQLLALKGYLIWLLPLVAIPWFAHAENRDGFLQGAVLGFGLAMLWSMVQFVDHYTEWDSLPGTPRTSNYRAAFFDNSLTWTGVLSMYAVARQSLSQARPGKLAANSWAALAVVGFSMQRTYWLAYPLGLLVTSVRSLASRLAMLGMLVAAGGVFILAADAIPGGMQQDNALLRTVHARFSWDRLRQSDSVKVRASLWRQSLKSIQDSPLLGQGPGTFRGTVHSDIHAGTRTYRHAHNGYLTLLSESGVVGLLILLAAFASLWRRSSPGTLGLFVVLAVSALTEATVLDSEISIAFCLWFSLLQQPVQLLPETG